MTNRRIIDILYEISELLEVKGENKFKIRAYVKLAQFLTGYSAELSDLYKEKGKEGILEIPHVGEGIGKKIIELLDTGTLGYLEELKKALPEGLETFLKIPGMGPKTAFTIGNKFKAATIPELEELLKEHRLSAIKGFGEKTEAKLLHGIEMFRKGEKRKLLGQAYPVAEEIVSRLRSKFKLKQISAAGSLRRMEDTIGDIDILAVSEEPSEIMDDFCSMEIVDYVIAKGSKKSSVYTTYKMQADLRVVGQDSYGAALQYFTGNKSHNVMLRELAVIKGFKLNEYGLYKGKKLIASENEESVYKALGLQYIPPELRTGSDEIEKAAKNQLPELVAQGDILGDLHMHSNFSDGYNTVEELAEAAKKRGYRYIALTDHSRSLKVAGGMDREKIYKQWKEIDRINKIEKDLIVLKGSEVDILEDGRLDYPDDILKELDLVIGSVHTKFKMTKEAMTARLLKAMENKYINIVGHISGRLINVREPYELDYGRIFRAAAANNVALEINSQPDRLDLYDVYVREAISKGARVCVSTDSHSTETLRYMVYGIGKARRGWAEKKDVINTMGLKLLREWLLKKG